MSDKVDYADYKAVVVERDALRAQLEAITAAWEKPTGWPEFGHDVEAILRGSVTNG